MAPTKTFQKRFAKRETTQRTFTFVRNWKNIAPEHQQSIPERSETQLNNQALISPVPQILTDNDNLSTSDIVNQSPVPVIVSHIANQNKHLQDDDDDEQEDDENEDDANDDDVEHYDIENDNEHDENSIGSREQSQDTNCFRSPKRVRSQTEQTNTKSVTRLSPPQSQLRGHTSSQKETSSPARSQSSKTDSRVSTASRKSTADGNTSRNGAVKSKGNSSGVLSSGKERRTVVAGRGRGESGSGVMARTPSGVMARTPSGVMARTPSGVMARTPSSLWQPRRVARRAQKNYAHPASSETSTRKNRSVVMVTNSPVEPARKPALVKVTRRQTRHQPGNEDRAVQSNESLSDDEDTVRCGTDVLDLDVIYECIEETEEEVLDEASSQICTKAVKKVLDVTKKELRKTISQVHQIKMNQAQFLKKKHYLKRLRTDLREIQQTKTRLRSEVTKHRKLCRVDSDLLQVSDWLVDFSKLHKQWVNNSVSNDRQVFEAV